MGVTSSPLTNDEAERQLVAVAERHREAVASMGELGRPEAGQHVAVKAVDRAVRLVCFALRRGAEAGIPTARLVELTGWDAGLVAKGLTKPDDRRFVAALVPPGLDHSFAAGTAAAVTSTARLDELAQEILAGVLDAPDPAPSADELDELHARLASEWNAWRAARILP